MHRSDRSTTAMIRLFRSGVGALLILVLDVAGALPYAWGMDLGDPPAAGLGAASLYAVLVLLAAAAAAAGVVLLLVRRLATVRIERDRIESALRRAEDFQRLFRQAGDPMLILDPGERVVLDANHRACQVYDLPREIFRGRPLSSLTHDAPGLEARLRDLLGGAGVQQFESIHFRPDNTRLVFQVTASLVEFGGQRAVLATHRDVSHDRKQEKQLSHRAFHDGLTDLANRTLFQERVEHAMTRAHRLGEAVIVGYVDLDRFKPVNDTLGHAAGDELLRIVARRLRSCVRVSDTVARLGGDEFAFLLEDGCHPQDSIAVAERILDELNAPFSVAGTVVTIGGASGSQARTTRRRRRNCCTMPTSRCTPQRAAGAAASGSSIPLSFPARRTTTTMRPTSSVPSTMESSSCASFPWSPSVTVRWSEWRRRPSGSTRSAANFHPTTSSPSRTKRD
jgi:diguanylate cyclase (GGDEF)-like protein